MTAPDTVIHIPSYDDEEPSSSGPRWAGLSWAVVGLAVFVVLFLQTKPRFPAFEWSARQGPSVPVNLDSIVALDDRLAVLSGITNEGVSLWWSDGSGPWHSRVLAGAPTQLAAGDGRLVAYRVRMGSVIVPDGDGWRIDAGIEFPAETRSRQASGRSGIVVTPEGLLEMSLFGDVWWSPGGQDFSRVIDDPSWGHGVERPFTSVCRPPSRSSPDVPPLVVTDRALVALVSSNPDEPFGIWPVCEPVFWTSGDGVNWTSGTTSLGEDGAYVYDVAWREDRMVAVGGYGIDRPGVWMSTDGVVWTDITPMTADSVDLYRVDAGGAGWVILGRDTVRSHPVGWTSRDGSCWEPLPPAIGGSDAVVTNDGILIVDRTTFPQIWMATPTGSDGACR